MQPIELEPIVRRHLLDVAETYCKATGYKLSHISRQAHSDSKFLDGLVKTERAYQRTGNRTGKTGSCTWRVYDKMISWFYGRWPEGLDFPHFDLTQLKGTHYESPQRQSQQTEGRRGTEEATREKEGTATGILAKLRRGVGE